MVNSAPKTLDMIDTVVTAKVRTTFVIKHDKAGESHYNIISALHKSIRNSDPDAALLWLARLIVAGEDAKFIARRLVRTAYEDIGLADPQACVQTQMCVEAVNSLGYPECDVAARGKQRCIWRARRNQILCTKPSGPPNVLLKTTPAFLCRCACEMLPPNS